VRAAFRFRAAVALAGAAVSIAPERARGQSASLESEDARLPGGRAGAFGLFTGVVGFSDEVEIGNSYYDDQVPRLGILFGGRAGLELASWSETPASPRVDLEGEARVAFASVDGDRASGSATVLGWRGQIRVAMLADRPLHPFLLAGVGAETLIGGTDLMEVPDTDLVAHGGLGGQLALGRRSALRADLRFEVMAARETGAAAAAELQIGYLIRFGGPGPRIGRTMVAAAGPAPEPAFVPPAPVIEDPDGDGSTGGDDACPTEAEDRDGHRDEDGCPDRDDDGDGLADAVDQCPREAETVNGFSDADGCADQVPADLMTWIGVIDRVRFRRRTIKLERGSREALDQLAAVLLRYPDVRLEIAAHTQAVAGDRELSQRQADYLKWFLVDKGVAAERLVSVGHGAARPTSGAAPSWRIEMKLLVAAPAPQGALAPDAPHLVWLPAVPEPFWLSPDARADLPLAAPRPFWLR
jgi:hypothetical protein